MFESRSARSTTFGTLFAGGLVVLFCFILLRHDRLLFWNDDYEISILPVFADVARSWSEGHWPILSPYSWVCGNLAGEFQYGTFSLFVNAAVVLIWKFPLGFAQQAATLSIIHLVVLAAGAFLLGRGRGLSFPLSILVSLVGTLNGWIVCWGATDWFGALGAFAWLPWAWWSMEKALEAGRSRWRFLWPAPFVYLVVTGGFPYTVVMLGVVVIWLSCKFVLETRRIGAVVSMLLGVALGFGLSAPAWLALLDYAHGSARETMGSAAHWQWRVPLRSLPGFILPCWTVNWTDFSTRYLPHTATELACGLVPPVALLAGLMTDGRRLVRPIRWELILLTVVVILSMAPSAGVFRWSFRWLPLVHLALGLCAAEALRILPKSGRSWWERAGVLALIVVAIVAAAMWLGGAAGRYAFPLTWIFLGLAAFWALSEVFPDDWRQWIPPALAFLALLATYLCIPTNCGVPKYNFSEDLKNPKPLDQNRLYLGVYSPAEYAYRRNYSEGSVGQVARPGSTPMWAQLRFINGYSPILTAGVAREFKFFIHGEIDEAMGKYLVENESGPAGILEQLGVDGLVVAPQIPVEPVASDWQLEFANDEGRVFHRRGPSFAIVRSVTWLDSRPNEEFTPATISKVLDKRNSLEFEAHVPAGDKVALLTVARPFFPGYEAHFGQKKLKVDSYRGLFPTIDVPAGTNGSIVLAYRPWWLISGGTVALLSAVIWVAGVMRVLIRGRS